MSPEESEDRVRLMLLITQHQRQIFGYIFTLVPSRTEAEDILQETNLVVCKKFDEFKEGTDFLSWACQIAWWNVRRARQKFARAKVVFDDDVLESVADTAATMVDELDHRHEALAECLDRLHPRDRELLLTRYEPGGGVEAAAQRCGRSIEAAYKAMMRLRKLLHDCISRKLLSEAAT